MNHLKCEIVKDLIPSYLDGICSETSKAAVNEHLKGCRDCRSFLEAIRGVTLTADAMDLDALDYMKKVKLHYFRKNISAVCVCLVFGLILLALPNASWFPPNLYYSWYHALFPLLMLSAAALLSAAPAKPPKSSLQKWGVGTGICGILYCFVLEFLCLSWPRSKSAFFSLPPEKIGVFLDFQRKAILFIELMFFLLLVLFAVKKEHSLGILPLLNLTGCFLCLHFGVVLHQLDTPDSAARLLIGNTLFVLCEGLALAGILLLSRKIFRRFQRHKDFMEP